MRGKGRYTNTTNTHILHIPTDVYKCYCMHVFKYTYRAHIYCTQRPKANIENNHAHIQTPDTIRSGGKDWDG